MKKEFAIFRARKLFRGRGKNSVSVCLNHLDKHDKTADISHPEVSENNETIKYTDNEKKAIQRAVDRHKEIVGKALRKDSSVAVEMIFTFSPSAAYRVDLNEFENRVEQFLAAEFPSMEILRIDYHEDETTPHWHVIGIPTDERGAIAPRKILGGPTAFRHHQDNFAAFCADLGLRRGVPKVTRRARGENVRHKPLRVWKSEVVDENQRLKAQNDFLKSDKYRQEILENDKIQQGQKIVNEIFKDDER